MKSIFEAEQKCIVDAQEIMNDARDSYLAVSIPAMFADGDKVEALEDMIEWGLSRGVFTTAELAKAVRGGLNVLLDSYWYKFADEWTAHYVDKQMDEFGVPN